MPVIDKIRVDGTLYDIKEGATIDPDTYSGSDADKLEAAIAAIGTLNHGTILLKRKYTLTRDLKINHNAETNARIIFQGIGPNCEIDTGAYSITSHNTSASYGMVSFENLRFTSTGSVFKSAYLIRVNFINCIFNGGVHAVENTRYLQSWTFNNCTFRDFTDYIIYSVKPDGAALTPQALDVHFNSCLIERSDGFLNADLVTGVTVMQSCIENLAGLVCIINNKAYNLVFSGNYFYSNNNDSNSTQFDFTGLDENLHSITISNNDFGPVADPNATANNKAVHNIILLPPEGRPTHGYIIIENNFINYAASNNIVNLVKAHATTTTPYKHVILRNNCNDYYSSVRDNNTNDHTLINLNTAEFVNVTDLDDGIDLDDILDPGVYYGSANTKNIANRPSATGVFYLLHIRRGALFAQIAITPDGLKSRIKTTGEITAWQ